MRICISSALFLVCGALSWGAASAQGAPLEELVPGGEAAEEPAAAEGLEQAATFRFGVSYHLLDRPDDPAGGDTLLSGSAFTGPGFLVGASYTLWELLPSLGLEVGLLYVHATATAFERQDAMAREVLVTADVVRVPWTVKGRVKALEVLHFVGGLGFDLGLGLKTTSEVREQNIPSRDQLVLQTRSVTTLELAASAGVEVDVGQVRLPLEVRFAWNPTAGATTPDRFDNYVSAANRGQYKVEFDYTTLFLLGVTYAL